MLRLISRVPVSSSIFKTSCSFHYKLSAFTFTFNGEHFESPGYQKGVCVDDLLFSSYQGRNTVSYTHLTLPTNREV